MHTVLTNYSSYFVNLIRYSIITVSYTRTGDLVFKVFNDSFLHFMFFIKNCGFALFKNLNDYTAVDYPEKRNRFELVLHLTSFNFNSRLRVKTTMNELSSIQTISHLFNSSN